MLKIIRFAAALISISSGVVYAGEVCDYTPTKLLGVSTATATGVGGAATAITGVSMKAAGLYAIQNAATGAWMIGSTAVGASAAGTTGILASTAGVLGVTGAFLMSAPVIIGGAVIAVGVGAYEGSCYISSKPVKK